MRIGLGTALLLATTSLVGLSPSPVAASTGCETPDTTWVGPATPEGSASWAEPSNWDGGVPTAGMVVCIPTATTGPRVPEGTQAHAGTVALNGVLTVAGTLDVATLEGDFGELHGPGTTTADQSITGPRLTLLGDAVVDLPHGATTSLGGEILVYDGSRLNAHGSVVLTDGATIDSFPGGLFTITDTGGLTLAAADSSAMVQGGFANHGQVTVTDEQHLVMLGASPEDANADQFSTGTFTGAPGAFFNVAGTELRDGALLDHVTFVDSVSVPADNSVTVAASTLVDAAMTPITGAGELVVTDGTVADTSIGGSLKVTVPATETFEMNGTLQPQARLQVSGNLITDPVGQLELLGTTTLGNGASISGAVSVSGTLESDPGATATASLSGAEVTGSVRAVSGTLSVPSLSSNTLAGGTLAGGEWSAARGATLDLPAIASNDAKLTMEGPSASFGDGLATLAGNGPNGSLVLRGGVDHEVPGGFRNEGRVRLSADSRLHLGGRFSQSATGRLVTEVDASGFGGVRAGGRRNLAGELVVERDPSYRPPVDTAWTLLTSDGRATADDRFDDVDSPVFWSRRIRPLYEVDRVRLRVDRVG